MPVLDAKRPRIHRVGVGPELKEVRTDAEGIHRSVHLIPPVSDALGTHWF